MSTQLQFARDVQGYAGEDGPQFPVDIFSVTLAQSTAKSFTVPSNNAVWVMYVRIEPAGWCWCSRTGTAAVPSGSGSFATSISELIVGTIEYKRTVYAGDVISFLTPNTTCDIGVSLYQVSYP